ncbi:HAD domain-containing protein [Caldimonas brevitalea]|uniref:Uncharacterized protein n=1 Tax=Caldimonas brevitalea TaxID=413882 RepID=A0A0G3BJ38_9BURK|nr:HAD domain-containing protein [Caldimonas brevitalea]AKJ27376.1 hypothetical protein AAW51_0685 [Caldimonas brevitalea]
MRVLFIDFDGCLHPWRLPRLPALQGGLPAPVCDAEPYRPSLEWLPVLERLLSPFPDVSIVVHSDWRHRHGEQEIATWLGGLSGRYLGRTPAGEAYESILCWLLHEQAVTSFRILDAAGADVPTPAPRQVIVCHPETGVSAPQVQTQLRLWLGRPVDVGGVLRRQSRARDKFRHGGCWVSAGRRRRCA